jgi:hypothetical protein
VRAISIAPLWWAVIISRNIRSNAAPWAAISWSIIPRVIAPGMAPMSIPPMPSMTSVDVPSGTSASQARRNPVMFSISGPWAALIASARLLTSALSARSGARSAIAMASRWWTIIIWANAMSASLCSSLTSPVSDSGALGDALGAVADGELAPVSVAAPSSSPQAARARVKVIAPQAAVKRWGSAMGMLLLCKMD